MGDIERIRDLIQPSDIKKCFGDGWISPDGLFYACHPEGHIEMAGYLSELGIVKCGDSNLYDVEDWMDNHNWLKLSDNEFRLYCYDKILFPTKNQINVIEDYAFHGKNSPGDIYFNGYHFGTREDFERHLNEDRGMI